MLMPLPLMTTYLGHRISIEPFEWGYLAQIDRSSGSCLLAGNTSVFKALEEHLKSSTAWKSGDGHHLLSRASRLKIGQSLPAAHGRRRYSRTNSQSQLLAPMEN